jgi:hypothetical protein
MRREDSGNKRSEGGQPVILIARLGPDLLHFAQDDVVNYPEIYSKDNALLTKM